jgi:hypothetical protein
MGAIYVQEIKPRDINTLEKVFTIAYDTGNSIAMEENHE